MKQPPKIIQWIADDLNELADYMERNEPMPNRTPSSAGFWFHQLQRELHGKGNLLDCEAFRTMLTPTTIKYLET